MVKANKSSKHDNLMSSNNVKKDEIENLCNKVTSYSLTKMNELFDALERASAEIKVIETLLFTPLDLINIEDLKTNLMETYRKTLEYKHGSINIPLKELMESFEKAVLILIDKYRNRSNDTEWLKNILMQKQVEFSNLTAPRTAFNVIYEEFNLLADGRQTVKSALQRSLFKACQLGDIDLVNTFLLNGADPLLMSENLRNKSAMQLAIEQNYSELVQLLLSHLAECRQSCSEKNDKNNFKLSTMNDRQVEIFQAIKDNFYNPTEKKEELAIEAKFSLSNQEVLDLLFTEQGAFFAETASFHQDQLCAIINEKSQYIGNEALSSFEYLSGHTYYSLGFSNNDLLSNTLDVHVSQLSDSVIIQKFLRAYVNREGFIMAGFRAASKIWQLGSLRCGDYEKPIVRFRRDANKKSVIVQEYIELNQFIELDDKGLPNSKIIYQREKRKSPQLMFITEYRVGHVTNSAVCVRIEKCILAAAAAVSPIILKKLQGISTQDCLNLVVSKSNLKFDGWQSLTVGQLKQVLINSPQLRELNLSNCQQLDTVAINELATADCRKTLYVLKLNNLRNLTHLSVANNVLGLPKLKQLDLSQCKKLQSIAINAPDLQVLNLRDCDAFDLNGSQMNCPQLNVLRLGALKQIMDIALLLKLVCKFPGLQILEFNGEGKNINDWQKSVMKAYEMLKRDMIRLKLDVLCKNIDENKLIKTQALIRGFFVRKHQDLSAMKQAREKEISTAIKFFIDQSQWDKAMLLMDTLKKGHLHEAMRIITKRAEMTDPQKIEEIDIKNDGVNI